MLLLVCMVAAGAGCPPPPPFSAVIDGLEWSVESQVAPPLIDYLDDELNLTVNQNFQSAAVITFNWLLTTLSLPGPGTPDGSWWPVTDPLSYQAYAQNNRDLGVEFGVFFVGHSTSNPASSTCGNLVYGVSTEISPNNIPSDPSLRFTFMFAQDIEDVLDECEQLIGSGFVGPDFRLNAWTGMITHELGHQRAGLTHPEDYGTAYHVFPYDDVMKRSVMVEEFAGRRRHLFCRHEALPPETGNETSCQGNLVRWRAGY